MTKTTVPLVLLILVSVVLIKPAAAQQPPGGADSVAQQAIRFTDSIFWVAYNSCDVPGMMKHFTSDIEFYHDKGGITLGVAALSAAMEKGICNTADSSTLRREEVRGSVKVYIMKNNGVIYAAVFSGDHRFYVTKNREKERAVGIAKFTHLWLLQDSAWKMSRVLSYDHQPPTYTNERRATSLAASVLKKYTGEFKGPATSARVENQGEALVLTINGNRFPLEAERADLFFSRDRDLTFEFVRNGKKIKALIVRERDVIAEVLTKVE